MRIQRLKHSASVHSSRASDLLDEPLNDLVALVGTNALGYVLYSFVLSVRQFISSGPFEAGERYRGAQADLEDAAVTIKGVDWAFSSGEMLKKASSSFVGFQNRGSSM